MEQHGKALMILVYKLGDFSEAERFCELHSKVKKSQTSNEYYIKMLASVHSELCFLDTSILFKHRARVSWPVWVKFM